MFDEKSYSLKMGKAIEVFTKELSSLRTGRANGFEAAICIDNCLPNVFTVSELSFVSKETITANFAKLSLTTVCKY